MVPTEVAELYDNGYITCGTLANAVITATARATVNGVVEEETIDKEYLIDEWTTCPQDVRGVEIIEEVMNKNNLPNVREAAIGLGLLAVAAWSFMQVFDVVATYIKEVL